MERVRDGRLHGGALQTQRQVPDVEDSSEQARNRCGGESDQEIPRQHPHEADVPLNVVPDHLDADGASH